MTDAPFDGFSFVFYLVPFFVVTIFVIVIVAFIVAAVKGVMQWNKNNNSPNLTVGAKVVAKRTDFRRYANHNQNNMAMNHTSTTYYVTFEVESGDRIELHVPNNEYGMLVEGDVGKLSFQGTRYKGFERIK